MMMNLKIKLSRPVVSWALYDWANSTFATTVLAGFFPIFFKQYWASDLSAANSTFYLGLGNAVASLAIALLAPILGALADIAGIKKRLLMVFMGFGVVLTSLMFFLDQGQWWLALACFCGATVGFMGANVFYDALLVSVCEENERNFVSSLGFALGYLGGGVLFAMNVALVLQPQFFGLSGADQAIKWSFLSVAVWWLVFSIPLWLFVDEQNKKGGSVGGRAVAEAIGRVWQTILHITQLKHVALFLLAYWLYIDGVDTVVRMAVDYGLSIGLQQTDLITALLITQFVGFPAALVFGHLGQRWGAKKGIYLGLLVYVGVIFWSFFMDQTWEFYVLAMMIGLVQGGVQALSRSYFSCLIPKANAAEFFGFYNMMGKSAAIVGPLLVGWLTVFSGSHRLGMLSILLLFIAGGMLLLKLPQQKA